MKQLITSFLVGFGIITANAQIEKLSGHANIGYIVPFNDYTSNNYSGADPNLAINAGLGYMVAKDLRLRGDITLGMLNGNNNAFFYQTTLLELRAAAEYNVLPLISSNDKWVVNIVGGLGIALTQARKFDINTRNVVAESPLPTGIFMSPNALATGGFNIGYQVHNNMQINLGFEERFLFGQEYMDATKSGSYGDLYGIVNLGVVFNLKTNRDKSKIEVDPKVYNQLKADIDSLANVAEAGNPQRIARLEMESSEKDLRIKNLELENDSLRKQKAVADVRQVKSDGTTTPAYTGGAVTKSSLEPAYRIVVVSMPSEARAQEWINRSGLEKENMMIVYVENLRTYRVVYNTYPSYAAAKKELQYVKGQVPDAWIAKF